MGTLGEGNTAQPFKRGQQGTRIVLPENRGKTRFCRKRGVGVISGTEGKNLWEAPNRQGAGGVAIGMKEAANLRVM